jgi:hypothetical protein
MTYNPYKNLLLSLVCIFISTAVKCQHLNFTDASLYVNQKAGVRIDTYAEIFKEEISRRSGISIAVIKKIKKSGPALFIFTLEENIQSLPTISRERIEAMESTGREGFKIITVSKEQTVIVVGNDERGILYGMGHLLRKMEIRKGEILVPESLNIATTPRYSIRGHQLGYRPKTNAYDAWSAEQFDQYIRELAFFGANSIEIMPPRTDDDFTSRHMQIPAIEMIAEQSRICDELDLDVWMWYPNMGTDYTNPDSIQKELKERHEVFSAIQRLDVLFVPGGDPGDLEPDILFTWLKQVSEVMLQYHPSAKIWVSPQVFRPTKEWFDVFYKEVNKSYPWFGGVVFGPWVKTPIDQIRRIVRPDIPIRRYPDITHSLSSQYPVPEWDLALAIALGRECINPRPMDQKAIHNALDEYANGSLSYSEGTNDDVNKFVWSDQDWDPERPVIETLRDYARFFIGPDYSEGIAQGLISLENNLKGPLLTNDQTIRTLQQWQTMEKTASQEVLSNPRFQSGLIRAYFDAYIQRRLLHETELEIQTRQILENASRLGSLTALDNAETTIRQDLKDPVSIGLKDRCYALADSLFRSFGAQLTIKKHGAMGGRGNFIDNIDNPLNDKVWLLSQMEYIRSLEEEEERLDAIEATLHRNDPGPGGFYDNFGSARSWNRVHRGDTWKVDPGSLASARVSFGVGLKGREWVHEIRAKGFEGQAAPMSWMHQVTTLYDHPLEITYDNLDPNSSYLLRVAYTGRFQSRMKLIAGDNVLIHDFMKTGIQPIYEFDIPAEAIIDGKLDLKWTCGEGERGSQVSEIWIIRKK